MRRYGLEGPEAVIVAAARTPIGRAGKGSLTQVRPDDLAAGVITAALAKVDALDPRTLDDIYVGCAEPRDEQGGNMARRIAVQLGLDNVSGCHDQSFLRLQCADRQDGLPRDQVR